MSISPEVVILTRREFEEAKSEAFQRGVKRGRFEATSTDQPVAGNCANWSNGTCQVCGVQWQGHEVHYDFKCPSFVSRMGGAA